MNNIIPFGNRILIKPVSKAQVLMSETGELSEYGEVVAIGSEVKTIKVGQTVGFSVFGVEKLVIEDEKYYFLQEDADFLLCSIED